MEVSGSSLADRLRRETRPWHERAERSGVMGALIRGTIEPATYGALLRNLHAIYAALEPALEAAASHAADDPVLAFVVAPPLPRRAALEADLDALCGSHWRDRLPMVPAARDYAAHLEALRGARAERLVAHAYVRYLGDLHGGQQLARVVHTRLALEGDAGTRFYDFGTAPQVQRLRSEFRTRLDARKSSARSVQAIVDEACDAFRRHLDLFEQLASSR
jgi:heme oxygenase